VEKMRYISVLVC